MAQQGLKYKSIALAEIIQQFINTHAMAAM